MDHFLQSSDLMRLVGQHEFSTTLQSGGELQLNQVNPQLGALLEAAGVSQDDLEAIAGEDRVISGAEFNALYRELVGSDPTERTNEAHIGRVTAVYEALQVTMGLRATDANGAAAAQVDRGFDQRERRIGGEDRLTRARISPDQEQDIAQTLSLEPGSGRGLLGHQDYVRALLASDQRQALVVDGHRRAAAQIQRPEGVSARVWNATQALHAQGVSAADAQFFMVNGTLPDLEDATGTVVQTGEQRMDQLVARAEQEGRWTAVNTLTYLGWMRRSVLAAERNAATTQRDALPADHADRAGFDQFIEGTQEADRSIRNGLQRTYRRATLAREGRGHRLVASAQRDERRAAEARAGGDTASAERFATRAQSSRDRGARIAHAEGQYRDTVGSFDAARTYRIAARAQIDTSQSAVTKMRRDTAAAEEAGDAPPPIPDAPLPELTSEDGADTTSGVPGSQALIRSAAASDPESVNSLDHLTLQTDSDEALAQFHQLHVQRDGYLDRAGADGTRPAARTPEGRAHRQQYLQTRARQIRTMGQSLGIYRAMAEPTAQDLAAETDLAGRQIEALDEFSRSFGTSIGSERLVRGQREQVATLADAHGEAGAAALAAPGNAAEQRETSDDIREAAGGLDFFKTTGEAQRDSDAIHDADAIDRHVGLHSAVSRSQADGLGEDLANSRDALATSEAQAARDSQDAADARNALRGTTGINARSNQAAFRSTRSVADAAATTASTRLDGAADLSPRAAARGRIELAQHWTRSVRQSEFATGEHDRNDATTRLDTAAREVDAAYGQTERVEAGPNESAARAAEVRATLAHDAITAEADIAATNGNYRPGEARTRLVHAAESADTELAGDADRLASANASIANAGLTAVENHSQRFDAILDAGDHVPGADDETYQLARSRNAAASARVDALGTAAPDALRASVDRAGTRIDRIEDGFEAYEQMVTRTVAQHGNGLALSTALARQASRARGQASNAMMSSLITGSVWLGSNIITGGLWEFDMKENVASMIDDGTQSFARQNAGYHREFERGAADINRGLRSAREAGEGFEYLNSMRILARTAAHDTVSSESHFAARDFALSHMGSDAEEARGWSMFTSNAFRRGHESPLAASMRGPITNYRQGLNNFGDERVAFISDSQSFMMNQENRSLEETTDGMGWIVGINITGEVIIGIIATGGFGSAAAVAEGGNALNAGRTAVQAANIARTASAMANAGRTVSLATRMLHTARTTALVGGAMMAADYAVGRVAGRNTGVSRGFQVLSNFVPIGAANRAMGLSGAARRTALLGTQGGRLAHLRGMISQGLSRRALASHARFYAPQFAFATAQVGASLTAAPWIANQVGAQHSEIGQMGIGLALNIAMATGVAGLAGRRGQTQRSGEIASELTTRLLDARGTDVPRSDRRAMQQATTQAIQTFENATQGRMPTTAEVAQLRTDLASALRVSGETPRAVAEAQFIDGFAEGLQMHRAAELGLTGTLQESGTGSGPERVQLSAANPPTPELAGRALDAAAQHLMDVRGDHSPAGRAQAYRDAGQALQQRFSRLATDVIEADGTVSPYADQLLTSSEAVGHRVQAAEIAHHLSRSTEGAEPVVAPTAARRIESVLANSLASMHRAVDDPNVSFDAARTELQNELQQAGLPADAQAVVLSAVEGQVAHQATVRHLAANQMERGSVGLTNSEIRSSAQTVAEQMGLSREGATALGDSFVAGREGLEATGIIEAGGETPVESSVRRLAAEQPQAFSRLSRMRPGQLEAALGPEPDQSRLAGLAANSEFVELVGTDARRARTLMDGPAVDAVGAAERFGVAGAELHQRAPAHLDALVRLHGEARARQMLESDPTGAARAAETAAEAHVRGADPQDRVGLRVLDGAESAQMLEDSRFLSRVDGDDAPALDAGQLRRAGLEPRYQATIDGRQIGLSEPFSLGHGRLGVVGYVQNGDHVEPRIFYRSNSQSAWRVSDASTPGHYGKGLAESDTALPLDLTASLSRLGDSAVGQIRDRQNRSLASSADDINARSEWLFRGLTVSGMHGLRSGAVVSEGHHYYSTAYAEGRQARTVGTQGAQLRAARTRVPDPAEIRLPDDPGLIPDFTQPPENTFTFDSGAMAELTGDGELTGRIYPSRNGELRYLVVEDAQGRAAVVGAERVGSEPSAWGNRLEYVELNGMDAPLFEYASQMSYAHGGDQRRGYGLNWNYVRETPLVREMYRQQGRSLPAALPESGVQLQTGAVRDAVARVPGDHRQRVMQALLGDAPVDGLNPEARQGMRDFVERNGQEGARFLSDAVSAAGVPAMNRLFAGRRPRQIARHLDRLGAAEIDAWRQTPEAQRPDRVQADFDRLDNLPPVELRVPHRRHHWSGVGSRSSQRKSINTVAEPRVDMAADIRAINEGRARRQGNDFHINGRIYRAHENGTSFPISGDGLHPLTRGEYHALQLYARHGGDTPEARLQLDRERVTEASRERALEVWRLVEDSER